MARHRPAATLAALPTYAAVAALTPFSTVTASRASWAWPCASSHSIVIGERSRSIGAGRSDQYQLIGDVRGSRHMCRGGIGDGDPVPGDNGIDELPGVGRLVDWRVGGDDLQTPVRA